MKKLLTLLLLLAVFESRSQGFEGTILWSMRMDITDPATKAKMEEAEKKMNDPATKAKMKEMEARMNDPEMKKMMEANPQMKAQMEATMKMMSGGGGVNSMMPKGMTLKVKGGNTLSRMDGGMMDGMEILHRKGMPSVRLIRKDKQYVTMPDHPAQPAGQPAEATKVTKTSEKATIAGYNCTKYIVETTQHGKPFKEFIWSTTDFKDFDFKEVAKRTGGPSGGQVFFTEVEGVPMKVEVSMPEGNMIMEVSSIKRESIPESEVSIPADFTELK